MREVMLTTFDNPYSPFDQFDEWYNYDSQYGYHTCEYLARIAKTSDELSDEDNKAETERAMDEICEFNPSLYKKLVISDQKS